MQTKKNQKIDLSGGITELPRVIEAKNAPPVNYVQGNLYKNADGRYCIDDCHALYCGSEVELFLCGKWLKTSIETDCRGQYYAVGLEGLKLAGKEARVKM